MKPKPSSGPITKPETPSSRKILAIPVGADGNALILPECFFCQSEIKTEPFSFERKWVCEKCFKEKTNA